MLDEASFLAAHAAACHRSWPKHLPREPHYPFGQKSLPEYLREWSRLQPEKPAVVFYGASLTYAELDRLSRAFASLLQAHGVKRGDRVAVLLPNCPQFHIAFYGILKAAAIHVPVNPMFTADEVLHELRETEAVAIIASSEHSAMVEEVRARTTLKLVLGTHPGELLPKQPDIPVPDALVRTARLPKHWLDFIPTLNSAGATDWSMDQSQIDAPAAINFTGGTTGAPKGCVHTQRDMIYTAACGSTFALRLDQHSVSLNFFPAFWMSGQNAALILPIFTGGTLILLARWDPVAFMSSVQKHRVTHSKALVDNVVELLAHGRRSEFTLRSLQYVHCVSFVKKLDANVRAEWHALTGSVLAESGWGMTETESHDTFTTGMQDENFDLNSGQGFVGLPVPGTSFKICDPETGALKNFGEEGEIYVRTPSLFKGYWSGGKVKVPLKEGEWFRTGDIGRIRESGHLYFHGRRKEMLKVRGMSVFPGEIEAVIGQHPATRACAVIGVPCPEMGERPICFVSLEDTCNPGPTLEELREWCSEKLAKYKIPEFRFVGSLPMTQTGKVKKEELKRQFSGLLT